MGERSFEKEVQSLHLGASQEVMREGAGSAASNLAASPAAPQVSPPPQQRLLSALVEEVRRYACGDAQSLILAGLDRTAEYQDVDYAALYWKRLLPFVKSAAIGGPNECELLAVAARQLALAMTYADSIRVAELKLRASRFSRIRGELGLGEDEILEISEFVHPRAEEIVDTMPSGLGRRLLKSSIGKALLQKLTARGRLIRSTSLSGFLLLYLVASLKRWRRGSLRYARETEGLEEWLDTVWAAAKHDLQLASSLVRARSLARGYGATYERGLQKFDMICEFVKNNRFSVAAGGVDALIAAAQAEEGTGTLEAAIATLRSQQRPVRQAMAGAAERG